MNNVYQLIHKCRAFTACFLVSLLASFFSFVTVAEAENVIINGTTLKVLSASTLVSNESISIKSGAILDNSGTIVIKKDLTNENIAATSLGSGTLVCSGNVSQSINGKNIIQNLTINNPAGVINGGENQVNGILTLTSGLVTLGANNLLLGPSSTVAGSPSASAMLVATGTGEVRKTFPAVGTFVFPVGDNTSTAEYSPVTLSFTAGTFAAGNYAGVNLVNTQYPGSPASGSFLKRYWNVSQSGITSFLCNATLKYVPADVNGTENLIYFVLLSQGSVGYYNVANTALHQITAIGLTAFGSITGFQALADKNLNLTLFLEGLYNGSGTMRKAQNSSGDQFAGTTADQIIIELRNSSAYSSLAYSLNNVNVSTTGTCTSAVPGILGGSYYVTLRHRNSLEVTSSTPVSFAGSPVSYNFTTLASQAFGSNMKLMPGGYWALFGGDITQNGHIDAEDMSSCASAANTFQTGYIPQDVNGDGIVDSLDIILTDNNEQLFVSAITP